MYYEIRDIHTVLLLLIDKINLFFLLQVAHILTVRVPLQVQHRIAELNLHLNSSEIICLIDSLTPV